MEAKIKNGYNPKQCLRCGKPMEWRKKWEKNWGNIKYCSNRCASNKKNGQLS